MSMRRPNTRSARFGLLLLALLHVVATAALPFTHRHLPSIAGAAAQVATASSDADSQRGSQDSGSVPHDDSSCTVCRTLASVDIPPSWRPAFSSAPVAAATPTSARSVIVQSRDYTSTHSRAPPRA